MGNSKPPSAGDIERLLRGGPPPGGGQVVTLMEIRTADGKVFKGTPEQMQVQATLMLVDQANRIAAALERLAPADD